jgi:hypothetical protein
VAGAEPERELIRRITPFALPAAAAAFLIGTLADGTAAGWSAAIGIAVVTLNFVANAWSLAWAAAISPIVVYGVALGGFVVRLAFLAVLLVLLRQLDWFSTVAFIAAFVPSTIALLVVEMKLLAGRMQADAWTFPTAATGARR